MLPMKGQKMNNGAAFKELLLFEIKLADKVEKIISDEALLYVLPIAFIAIIWEVFGSNRVVDVVKSFLLSVVMILSFTTIYTHAVDISFSIAEEIVELKGGKNQFISAWRKHLKSQRSSKDKSFSGKFKSAIKLFRSTDDIVLSFVSLAILGIMILTAALYTLGYYLNYIFISISSLIGILPLTRQALLAPIKGTIWSCLVPISCAVVIAILGSIVDVTKDKTADYFLYDVTTYIQVGVVSLCLLLVLPGVTKLINGQSMSNIANTLAISSTRGVATAGAVSTGAWAGAKITGASVQAGKSILSPATGFMSSTRSAIQTASNHKRDNLGLRPSMSQILNSNSISDNFNKRVQEDILSGKGVVSPLLNPANHAKAAKETIVGKVSNSAVGEVFKGGIKGMKQEGVFSGVKTSTLLAADRVINRKSISEGLERKKNIAKVVKANGGDLSKTLSFSEVNCPSKIQQIVKDSGVKKRINMNQIYKKRRTNGKAKRFS